jgi:ABC-type dipeptide/oligopeptide/nickel transport system permease subunit
LDSDPANRQASTWDLTIADRWIDPGILEIVLIVAALPAFIVGGISVAVLGRLGINQVSSFFVLMPILIFMWFHFVGRLVDRLFGARLKPGA